MIQPGVKTKLPSAAFTYFLTSGIIGGLIFVVLGFWLMSLGSLSGTSTVGGVTAQTAVSSFLPGMGLIALGVLVFLYQIFYYQTFSYAVGEQNITVNYGVIFRQSRTMDFGRVQNVDNVRGPVLMLFGLTAVNIWTSSPGQLHFTTSTVDGRSTTSTQPKPDGKLYLLAQDAEELKNYIASKGAVQNVQVVQPNAGPTPVSGANPPAIS